MISPRTAGRRTLTCELFRMREVYSSPRATCTYQSFPASSSMAANTSEARTAMRNSSERRFIVSGVCRRGPEGVFRREEA